MASDWFCVYCDSVIEPRDIYIHVNQLSREVINKGKVHHCGPVGFMDPHRKETWPKDQSQ